MDWKLELLVVPVSDVDRAKAFYMEKAGFGLDVDHQAGDFRVVQLTPLPVIYNASNSARAMILAMNASCAPGATMIPLRLINARSCFFAFIG